MTAPTFRPAAHYVPSHRGARQTIARLSATHDLLDATHDAIHDGDIANSVNALVVGLRETYDAVSEDVWRAFAEDVSATHRTAVLMREDPFIRRAYEKPRGYPGDAGILDLIYGTVPLPDGTTALGAQLYEHDIQSPACVSVRERRGILVDAIDRAAADAPGGARVLSIACGHLREAQVSPAVRDGAVAEFHALDQDERSLALIEREHAALGVTPVHGSVRDLLAAKVSFSGLSLAYAAGLYDYLPTPVAARLTRTMFDMLAPGGRLLVANFCRNALDVAAQEALMAWRLIHRDEQGMAEIASEIPGTSIARQRTFRDSGGNVVYLEIQRV